ncbi:hypothetical protein G9A89_003219 [Geosiphon pyriformis]|nr:hypothetical protein G9A89_003219 [Geosiphon pyriformis]
MALDMNEDPPDYLLPPNSVLPAMSFIPVEDDSQYKSWVCLYPAYFDSTKTVQQGRRVIREQAVPNPLAKDLAEAVKELGLSLLYEPQKTYPRDWQNPGRVRVGLKIREVLADQLIPTRKELIKRVNALMPAIQAKNKQEFPPKNSPAVFSGALKDGGGGSGGGPVTTAASSASSTAAVSNTSSSSASVTKKKGRKGRK